MPKKKIGLMITHAADNPELAAVAFIIANGAIAMDVEPVVFLQSDAVTLATSGGAEAAIAEGFTPLPDLIDGIIGAGYRIMACSPCLAKRDIAEEDLLDGFYVGGAGIIVEAMLSCENFLRY